MRWTVLKYRWRPERGRFPRLTMRRKTVRTGGPWYTAIGVGVTVIINEERPMSKVLCK